MLEVLITGCCLNKIFDAIKNGKNIAFCSYSHWGSEDYLKLFKDTLISNGYDIFEDVFGFSKDDFIKSSNKKYAVTFCSGTLEDAKRRVLMNNEYINIGRQLSIDLFVVSTLSKAFDNNFHIKAIGKSSEIEI